MIPEGTSNPRIPFFTDGGNWIAGLCGGLGFGGGELLLKGFGGRQLTSV
jgi:hypothetical protein